MGGCSYCREAMGRVAGSGDARASTAHAVPRRRPSAEAVAITTQVLIRCVAGARALVRPRKGGAKRRKRARRWGRASQRNLCWLMVCGIDPDRVGMP